MDRYFFSKIKGFTLIELLVVVAIIGLMSTITIVFVGTSPIMQRARDARITQDFQQLLNLAEKINLDKGNYDSLCLGPSPCNEDLQKLNEDINKRKGTLVIQKPEIASQSYCAFSPLNQPAEGDQTQYYCIDTAGGKIKTIINPGIEHCTNLSFKCPSQEEQLAALEKGVGGFVLPPLTAAASIFTVSGKTYPNFLEVVIDPLDVSVGDIQIMTVKIEDPDEISWVRADIEHDNGYDTIMLALVEGDSKLGKWGGQWRVHDTHKKTYHTTFTAQNRKGKQGSVTMAWTDPCFPPSGGNWTLDSNCTTLTSQWHGGVTGVDNGNFTVSGGFTLTLTGGTTWVFNPGKSITINKDGSKIVIEKTNGGGQIKKTNLWMVDADGDTYASSTASIQYFGLSAPVVGGVTAVRRNTMAATGYAYFDYDDRSAVVYYNTACETGSASQSDSYTDETKISSKSNITVTGGQMKSELSP